MQHSDYTKTFSIGICVDVKLSFYIYSYIISISQVILVTNIVRYCLEYLPSFTKKALTILVKRNVQLFLSNIVFDVSCL